MLIEDGKGSGRKAEVNPDNRLVVQSVTVPCSSYINKEHGKVWSVPLDAVAPSGETWFFVLFNSGVATYAVSQVTIVSTVAGVFRSSRITGSPTGGTNITSTSLNTGKTILPTGVLVQKGTSITGLTEGDLISPFYLQTGQPSILQIESMLIIPPGTVGWGLKAPVAATINGYITICELE